MLGRLDILGDPLQSQHSNDAMWHVVSGMNTNEREDVVSYFNAQPPMGRGRAPWRCRAGSSMNRAYRATVYSHAAYATGLPAKVRIWRPELLVNMAPISRRKFQI